jgi:hypothetical protein
MTSRGRRSSLPAIKLSGGALIPPRKLSAISDCTEATSPEPPKKCSSLDNLGKPDTKRDSKARRHSVVTLASSGAPNKNEGACQGVNSANPRRHSLTSIDSGKEAMLKSRPLTISAIEERMREEEEQGAGAGAGAGQAGQAWALKQQQRRGSAGELPDGSHIFQLAMADFLPDDEGEEPAGEHTVTVTTVRLKDCSDSEEGGGGGVEQENGRRRIRWSKEVNVIS